MALTKRIAIGYDHEQAVASTAWTINHNLGGYPIADAYVMYEGDMQRILPSAVTYVDENTCTLTFAIARAGFASVV